MALQDDIDALRAAIAKGVSRVTYDGHTVEYRSLSEMNATLASLERRAGTRTAAAGVAYPEFSRDGA